MSSRNSRFRAFMTVVPVLAAGWIVTGCNSDSSGSAASTSVSAPTATVDTGNAAAPVTETTKPVSNDPAPTPTATATSAPAPSPSPTQTSAVQVGESCQTGDSSKLCLAMHFVTYQDSSGSPTATEEQAANIIHNMNQIWSQCDIGFQIETYEPVDPTQFNLAYGAQSQNQLNQIRSTFNTRSDELLGVTTGPWGTSVNGWTNMPGSGPYGAIMEASIVEYGGGIIYAHEFGHYLGLDHASDTSNLMNPVIYTTSTRLTTSQCQLAQQVIKSNWSKMIRQ